MCGPWFSDQSSFAILTLTDPGTVVQLYSTICKDISLFMSFRFFFTGLMVTSAFIYHVLHFINVTIDIRNMCVFLAPLFSSLTTLVTYHLTRELKDSGAGLVAAAMIAIVPGYISRSVAGSYDNEGIAIFCMLLTYLLWVKSVKTGSVFWSTLCALAYFYMVSRASDCVCMCVHVIKPTFCSVCELEVVNMCINYVWSMVF